MGFGAIAAQTVSAEVFVQRRELTRHVDLKMATTEMCEKSEGMLESELHNVYEQSAILGDFQQIT